MRLQEKVALITGAGSGIGRETSLLFAQEGAAVVAVDVNLNTAAETAAMVEAAGGRAGAFRADVARADDCAAMVQFAEETFGVLVQYPATDGDVLDYESFAVEAHAAGALVVVAADLLALALLREPAAFGADIAVGNSQRFGVPLGYGGPHAGYLATKDEHKRQMPGRLMFLHL